MEEWKTEPNFVVFTHTYKLCTIPCVIQRVPHSGHLCGYVGVPVWSPWHGKEPSEAEVHGGITYSEDHLPRIELDLNFHVSWWIGFDCAHSGDYMPLSKYNLPDATYRNMEYVKQECRNLAEQTLDATIEILKRRE